ncbi:MAG: OmpA family protein [Pseudomonadota bacterium]
MAIFAINNLVLSKGGVMIYRKLLNVSELIIGVLGLIMTANMVHADNEEPDVIHFRGHAPTPEEYIEALAPDETPAEEPITGFTPRGIYHVSPRQAKSEKPKVISLNDNLVHFAFDSYELTARAEKVLNSLGIALESPKLKNYQFLIEGHTDAVGAFRYNQILSERRAESAKLYLVSQFNVEPHRLLTVGRGEGKLLRPDNPQSGENRRITVIRLYRALGQ